jgi:hypothetical protein
VYFTKKIPRVEWRTKQIMNHQEDEYSWEDVLLNRDLIVCITSFLPLQSIYYTSIVNGSIYQHFQNNKEIWKGVWQYYHNIQSTILNKQAYMGAKIESNVQQLQKSDKNFSTKFDDLLKTVSEVQSSDKQILAQCIIDIWTIETKQMHLNPSWSNLSNWMLDISKGLVHVKFKQLKALCCAPSEDSFSDSDIQVLARCLHLIRQRNNGNIVNLSKTNSNSNSEISTTRVPDKDYVLYEVATRMLVKLEKLIYKPTKLTFIKSFTK